ncbi:MAG: NAD(P)/FAD-dependent oxidoreductase [Hahellaceae bacterium]|nr:NAD(P)/FAD-dependent oxidoreductase [Hahellaceae bacterium]MCP5212948.1 NAD(P)/FAD-dependent oxidoreductase [Hahellaceae bacterium]
MDRTTHIDTLIIGSGFGGIGMAIRLQKSGLASYIILEKAASIGGCWRDNSYPGAACDVPSHLYSYSFEPDFPWSRKFAPQTDINSYIAHCAKKWNLISKVHLNTEVQQADYDSRQQRWRVTTTAGDTYICKILISATGQLSLPAYPHIKGLDEFKGKVFHSAKWDHQYNLTGKHVAVIGSGASAVQLIPEVAKKAKALYVFQRSAPYVLNKPDRAYSSWEQTLKSRFPLIQLLDRWRLYWQHELRFFAFGGNKLAMKLFTHIFQHKLTKEVHSPELRKKLTPDYLMGCKRILISNNYFSTFNEENVSLVTDEVEEVSANTIKTSSQTITNLDAIIFATGFQSTRFLSPIQVTGLSGKKLADVWKDGAEAYLGMAVSGFPNFFMIYGPNTNLGHNSILAMIENQIRYIHSACQVTLLSNRPLNVRPNLQRAFNANIQEKLQHSVWGESCNSWYKTNGGKITNNWYGFVSQYYWLTKRVNMQDYES